MKRLVKYVHKTLKILGPGFVTGSADDDPSGIGTYSMGGAQFGLLLLWLIPFQLPMMYVLQSICGRIGLVTGKGLAAIMKENFPKVIVYCCVGILVVANTINIGANIAIMASCMKLLFGFSRHLWAILVTVFIVVMQVVIPYHAYSKILLSLSFFLLSYAITAVMVIDNWAEVFYYIMVPHIQWNKDFLLLMTGVIGTTISPYLFFWHTSQEIEEKLDHKTEDEIRDLVEAMPLDTFMGMFFSQLMALFIVLTCYGALYKNGGASITSAYDAAMALQPLAGEFASVLFSLGIIGAGLLGISVLAGSSAYACAELFNKPEGLNYTFFQAPFFYGVIIVSTVVGLVINCIGINPMQALLYAAVVNCIAAVPLVGILLIVSNKKEIMGEYANGLFFNVVGVIALCVMAASAGVTLLSLWW